MVLRRAMGRKPGRARGFAAYTIGFSRVLVTAITPRNRTTLPASQARRSFAGAGARSKNLFSSPPRGREREAGRGGANKGRYYCLIPRSRPASPFFHFPQALYSSRGWLRSAPLQRALLSRFRLVLDFLSSEPSRRCIRPVLRLPQSIWVCCYFS